MFLLTDRDSVVCIHFVNNVVDIMQCLKGFYSLSFETKEQCCCGGHCRHHCCFCCSVSLQICWCISY